MLKWRHFMTQNFTPKLDADLATTKKASTLHVWIDYGRSTRNTPSRQLIFSLDFNNDAEAIAFMKGFGHGFEYAGVKWVEVCTSGELKEIG